VQVHAYDFHYKMYNNNRVFRCLSSALMENMIFIVLPSLENVHDTAQYRYCVFSLLYRLLRIRLKRQNHLLS